MAKERHLRDKKITILKNDSTYSPNGFPEEHLKPIPKGENIWAYYEYLSGKEFYAAKKTNLKIEVLFEISWRNDISTRCIIRYRNKDYEITNIDDSEGYKKPIKIYCMKIN